MKSGKPVWALLIFTALLLFPLEKTEAGEPFTISTSYNNLLSNPQQTGLLDRLMVELFERVGMEMALVFTVTEKSLIDVNARFLDGDINRIEGMERAFPNLVRIPESNMTMHFVAFSKRSFNISGWSSIKPLYVGLVRGWKILEMNTRGFPNIIKTPTERELFTMLHKNRLDVALYAKRTGYAALKHYQFKEIHHLEPPLASRPMYLYVHKKHQGLVNTLAETLKQMKEDGSYMKIMSI